MLTQGKVQIPAVIVVTVDIGDDGGVGVISSSSSSSGHGHGYDYGGKRGGVDQRGVVGMKQSGMGNGQLPLTSGNHQSVGNGQQQQAMDGRWLGQRMGSQRFGNGIGHQRSMNGIQQPGHLPQIGMKAQNGVRRSQGYGLILANQSRNTGLDPRRQPQKHNAPGLPISFHYLPHDS